MKRVKYNIGDTVSVTELITRHKTKGNYYNTTDIRILSRHVVQPFTAYIVGITNRYDGQVHHASGGHNSFDGSEYDYNPACFIVSKSYAVLRLRRHMRGAELLAFPEACTPAPDANPENDYWQTRRMTPEGKASMEYWRYKCPICGRFTSEYGTWQGGRNGIRFERMTVNCKIHGEVQKLIEENHENHT